MHYVLSIKKQYSKVLPKVYNEEFIKNVLENLYDEASKWTGDDLER